MMIGSEMQQGAGIQPDPDAAVDLRPWAAYAVGCNPHALKAVLAKRHKPKTLAAYTVALRYFAESCSKQYVEDVSREDLLAFSIFLRDKKKQAPRSVANKFENTMTFLKSQGVRGLIGKNDWPRYVEQEPEIYEREELDALFAACDENERGSNFSL